MSLLDDVSIVVTPNGYKAGELYAVIPVPTEGAEEIATPDFSSSTGWSFTNSGGSNGWIIDSGRAICDSSATTPYRNLNSTFSLVNGKSYRLIIDILQSADNMIILVGSTTLTETLPTGTNLNYEYFIPESAHSGGAFSIYAGSSDLQEIDNVSVKEYTSADMDVTRATAATRVDENGLVNYAEIIGGEEVTNGDFSGGSTGWTVNNSDADNYVVFDGSTARLKFLNTSPVTEFKTTDSILTSGKTYKLTVDIALATSGGVKVDGNGISETFNSVGVNERIITPTGNAPLTFYRATANVDLTFNSVSVKEVIRDSVPRIDYTGGGCPHILAEPQRTNLIPYSEAFNSWNTIQFVTVSEDTSETTSPSGNNTASKITINSASTVRRLFEVISTSSGSDYTFTLYAKKGTTDYIRILFSSVIIDAEFNLTNGTVTAGTGSIEAVGNDWYRLQGTGTSSLTTEVPQIQLSNSASVNDYLYIWGAQVEQGSYATSYIPTSGSTVTRNQDIFTRDGISSLINSTEGVLFVEMAALANDGTSRAISIFQNGSNFIKFLYSATSNRVDFVAFSEGNLSCNITKVISNTTENAKFALKWKQNDFALWIDGIEEGTDLSGNAPLGMDKMYFTDEGGSNGKLFGKVKQLQVYDTALTDTQLAALTS